MRFATRKSGRARLALLVAASLLCLPLGSVAAPWAVAAEPQQQPDTPDARIARGGGFSASIEMVRVPVVVIDKERRFIRDLAPADFAVQDGGKRYEVEHFVSDAEPVSVGIIVDRSAEMKAYAEGIRQAVVGAAANLRPEDELFLITYADTAESFTSPSSERTQIIEAAGAYAASETSERALYDAADLGLSMLEKATYDKRSLILIGAGQDTSSAVGELALQQHIHRAGVSIHAIVLGDPPARRSVDRARVNRLQTLPEIVRYTGGLLAQKPKNLERFGGNDAWIAAAGTDIVTYVKHQYLLHYAPQNPPRPGVWRSIRVSLDVEYRQVRARSGYMR